MEGAMEYKPKPINTDGVELPAELCELRELLAENVHDCWAQQRMSEGWTYGEAKSESKKTTPYLVEYSKLTEEEKEYDRVTAMQTLKAILMLGYSIEKKEEPR